MLWQNFKACKSTVDFPLSTRIRLKDGWPFVESGSSVFPFQVANRSTSQTFYNRAYSRNRDVQLYSVLSRNFPVCVLQQMCTQWKPPPSHNSRTVRRKQVKAWQSWNSLTDWYQFLHLLLILAAACRTTCWFIAHDLDLYMILFLVILTVLSSRSCLSGRRTQSEAPLNWHGSNKLIIWQTSVLQESILKFTFQFSDQFSFQWSILTSDWVAEMWGQRCDIQNYLTLPVCDPLLIK